MCVPPIQDVSFNLVQFFPEKAARFKIQEAPIAGSSESGRRGEKERGNVRSASHSLLTESCMTSSLSPFFQLATSPEKPCKILSHHTVVTSGVLCCAVLCCVFLLWSAYLWLITSMLPYCSIQSCPTIML